jgi:hypothetical protein
MKLTRLSLGFRILLAALLSVGGISYWAVTHLCVDNMQDKKRAESVASLITGSYSQTISPTRLEHAAKSVKLRPAGCCFGNVTLVVYETTDTKTMDQIQRAALDALHAVEGVKTIQVRFFEREVWETVPSGTQRGKEKLLREFSVP